MHPDALMIFAAGLGTRMLPLTESMPKPMVPVAGKPLIDYSLAYARQAQIDRIVANVHYLPEALSKHLQKQGVHTVLEFPTLLETGGGLKNALPLLNSDCVFVINSDAIWTNKNPLVQLRSAWNPTRMDALLLLVPTNAATQHSGNGDFDADESLALSRGTSFVYSGAHITKTAMLRRIDQDIFSLNLLWDKMISKNRLFGIIHDGGWCDVGRPGSISVAEEMLSSR
jgi:N-acetyl-alpha-D-muramate 1-phosphate uridylyltransferase